MYLCFLLDLAVLQVHQVIAHEVDQEVDLILCLKIEKKHYLHHHLNHLLAVNRIENQVTY